MKAGRQNSEYMESSLGCILQIYNSDEPVLCRRESTLICSVCQFLWCKYSHHGHFQTTNTILVNAELWREAQHWLLSNLVGLSQLVWSLEKVSLLSDFHSLMVSTFSTSSASMNLYLMLSIKQQGWVMRVRGRTKSHKFKMKGSDQQAVTAHRYLACLSQKYFPVLSK